MKTGIELIAEERHEQIEKYGRTIALDVQENTRFQLRDGAAELVGIMRNRYERCPVGWSEKIWQKMCDKGYKERLIIAGALIAAEIDRIQADNNG